MRLKLVEVIDDIKQMDQSELQTVLNAVKRRHKQLVANVAERVTDSLVEGDYVWFDAKTCGVIKGTVKKINTKTVNVLSDQGVMWTVHATLVHRATRKAA